MHKVFVNTCFFLITRTYSSIVIRELFLCCSYRPIECNRLLHVTVTK